MPNFSSFYCYFAKKSWRVQYKMSSPFPLKVLENKGHHFSKQRRNLLRYYRKNPDSILKNSRVQLKIPENPRKISIRHKIPDSTKKQSRNPRQRSKVSDLVGKIPALVTLSVGSNWNNCNYRIWAMEHQCSNWPCRVSAGLLVRLFDRNALCNSIEVNWLNSDNNLLTKKRV